MLICPRKEGANRTSGSPLPCTIPYCFGGAVSVAVEAAFFVVELALIRQRLGPRRSLGRILLIDLSRLRPFLRCHPLRIDRVRRPRLHRLQLAGRQRVRPPVVLQRLPRMRLPVRLTEALILQRRPAVRILICEGKAAGVQGLPDIAFRSYTNLPSLTVSLARSSSCRSPPASCTSRQTRSAHSPS